MNLPFPPNPLTLRLHDKRRTLRRTLAHGVGLLGALVVLGLACASDPPPRPARLDPSSTAAPESKPIGPEAELTTPLDTGPRDGGGRDGGGGKP